MLYICNENRFNLSNPLPLTDYVYTALGLEMQTERRKPYSKPTWGFRSGVNLRIRSRRSGATFTFSKVDKTDGVR